MQLVLNHQQAALLILRALEAASDERQVPLSRGRFSPLALRLLWGRKYKPDMSAINEDLLPAGWFLIPDGRTYLGALRVSVIQDWHRISVSSLDKELEKVDDNSFEFGRLEYLLDADFWSKRGWKKTKSGKAKKERRR